MTFYPNLRPWITHPEAVLVILHGAIDSDTALLYWRAYRPRRRIDRANAMLQIEGNETAQDLYSRASMILREALSTSEVRATGRLAGGTSSPVAADDWVRLTPVSMWGDDFRFGDGRTVDDVLICSDDLRGLLSRLVGHLRGNDSPPSASTPKARSTSPAEVERQYRAYINGLPEGTTGLRELGQAFLRSLGVKGSVREMEKKFRSHLPNKPKRGRQRKGLPKSAE